MHRLLVFCALFLFAGCDGAQTSSDNSDTAFSNIRRDEHVVFFRTAGWLDAANQEWYLPIHGWIYEPQDSSARKAAFEELLEKQFDLIATDKTEANLSRRFNLLIADNERGKDIVVNLAGRSFELPLSSENGHFKTTVVISAAEADEYAENRRIRYSAVTRESEIRTFSGEVRLVGPAGLSVISDIDDTVKISNVTDKKSLLEYTFLLDFAAAPGMADLYERWSDSDVSFHFVSSSPWQLYSPLREFLDSHDFPWATFSLKAIRFRDESLLDLFKKGTETKPAAIREILSAYPARQFILVGDSGEQDPEVYAALIREHDGQILKAFIRNVTQETSDNERFESVFGGIDSDRWQLFEDPQSLKLPVSP